ncbi:hypothetical protein [Terrarubrum flagellatum]|uniref:hypothetical protein n=1 Tax=Terrirubrum flagellatum TaxID=2895980 RepID=UPI003145379E
MSAANNLVRDFVSRRMIATALILLAAAAIATSVAADELKWVTYQSPTGFYSVEHPGDWRLERDENILNIIPGDKRGAVTISAYVSKSGKPSRARVEQLISSVFRTQRPTSPLLAVTGSGWEGLKQTFIDESITPHVELQVIVATSADGMVIITSNEASPRIAERIPVYTRILRSLTLSTPRLR